MFDHIWTKFSIYLLKFQHLEAVNVYATTPNYVFWLSTFYSIFPLAVMVISYSMICYKIRLSTLHLKATGAMTFNKHQNEAS